MTNECHPFSLKIKAFYDDDFRKQFGNDSENAIRRMLAQAQNVFRYESLTSKVIFKVQSIEYLSGSWSPPNDMWVEAVNMLLFAQHWG